MKGKHTPGPWRRYYGSMSCAGIASVDDKVNICVMCDADPSQQQEVEADAALIAAAPDLLEALKDIIACCRITGPVGNYAYIISDERREAAKAAIAKAEGA